MNILVAGATGQTGRLVVGNLTEAGHNAIAMVREGSDTSALPANCETRKADLTDLPSDICDGVDVVIFAAGSGADTDEAMTRKVDRDGAMALTDRAENADLKRFVMLSSVGTDNPENGPEPMQHYLRAKQAADRHLIESDIDHIIVRPVQLTNDDGGGAVELSKESVENEKIARKDVADVLAKCVTLPGRRRAVFEIAVGSVPINDALAEI